MIKKVFFTALVLTVVFAPKVWAYDFSAKCKSGQTLYYNVTSSTKPYTVEVASCESAQGDLVIPSTVSNDGKKYSVTGIGMNAFYKCKELKSVNMPNSIASIGDSAFYRCEGLASVKIPKSVKSIGNGAFGLCDNFTDIIFESDITLSDADLYFVKKGIKYSVLDKKSVKTMPHYIIYTGEIRVPDPNSEDPDDPDYISVEEEMEGYLCPEDSIIIIPETIKAGNTFTVTSIGDGGFGDFGCFHIKSITIPSSVTSIGRYAFSGCENLKSITIPNSVTSIGDDAFSYSGLTSINIPNSVTSIGKRAFVLCNLESIKIPYSVTTIGDSAFDGCPIKSVIIPNSVKSIGKNAFAYCDSITDITLECDIDISDADLHVIKDGIKYTMVDKKSVKVAPDFKYVDYKIGGPYGYYQEFSLENTCPKGETIIIPETITAGHTFTVTSIADSAFQGCSYIESVTIPNTVTSIGENAFAYCSKLLSVTIPNSVTSIDDMAFYGCNHITSLTIPNSITSIGNNAFTGIKNIVYSGTAIGSPWSALTVNGYVEGDLIYSDKTKKHLTGCNPLATEVVIPNSVISIDDAAFYNCKELESVTIGNSVKSIGKYAFENCEELTSVTIPNSVTSIGDEAFKRCLDLTSVTIGNSVTSIGEEAFYGCWGLTSVNIPESVKFIGDGAFRILNIKLPEETIETIKKINEKAIKW